MGSHFIDQVIVRVPSLTQICKFQWTLWAFKAYDKSDNHGQIVLENARNVKS